MRLPWDISQLISPGIPRCTYLGDGRQASRERPSCQHLSTILPPITNPGAHHGPPWETFKGLQKTQSSKTKGESQVRQSLSPESRCIFECSAIFEWCLRPMSPSDYSMPCAGYRDTRQLRIRNESQSGARKVLKNAPHFGPWPIPLSIQFASSRCCTSDC